MRDNFILKSDHFMGHPVSRYGMENGYVDYHCLASCFDAVLNNDIMRNTVNIGYWELFTGIEMWYSLNEYPYTDITEDEYEDMDDEEKELFSQCYADFYQFFIISENGAKILSEYTNECVWYNDELDMFVWGVTHFGTSWDYVLTNIKIAKGGEDNG